MKRSLPKKKKLVTVNKCRSSRQLLPSWSSHDPVAANCFPGWRNLCISTRREHISAPPRDGRDVLSMPIPDEDIFPHATGAALSTVEAHKEHQELVFYAGWVSHPRLTRRSFEGRLSAIAVLSICPEELDCLGRERDPLSVQRSQSVQEGKAFPRFVVREFHYLPSLILASS
jgi:hypothetical protein